MKKRTKINNIKVKLLSGMIILSVLPLLILGIGSYNQSKEKLEDKLKLTSMQTLNEINVSLNEYFSSMEQLVSITSENTHLLNVKDGDNLSYISDLLKTIKDSNADVMNAYFAIETKEMYIYPKQSLPDGYDPTSRGWYKEALSNKGNVIITPPYEDASTGANVITMAKAVVKDNKVVGVVAIDCSLKTLASKIAEKKVGNTGSVFLSDVDGKIIAHKDEKLVNTDTASKL